MWTVSGSFLPLIPFAWHLDIDIRASRTQWSQVSFSPAEIRELALHHLDKLGRNKPDSIQSFRSRERKQHGVFKYSKCKKKT